MRIATHAVIFISIYVLLQTRTAQADTEQIRKAVDGGLKIVQAAAKNYPTHRDCFSCHHQTLPMLAMDLASKKDFTIDRELLQDQAKFTWQTFDSRRDKLSEGKGIGGASMTVGYGLWALHIAGWEPDSTTNAMVTYLLKKQSEDGSWKRSSDRPPLEESNLTCTILATYYMGKFASDEQRAKVDEATKRARNWILSNETTSHEDLVSKLGALALLRASTEEIGTVRKQIFASQREDGGWAQLSDMESDAYATGLTLFTLHRVRVSTEDPNFQRGVLFLLKSQCDDGSWFVKSRSKPIQEMFDNGDPHGEDQFISIAATSWATAALTLALPEIKADKVGHRSPAEEERARIGND